MQENFKWMAHLTLAKIFQQWYHNNSSQMYSLQARREEVVVPVFYILMYKRTFQGYERVFNTIINKTKLRVESVMLDFEFGAIKA
ncbi:MAG: hypothetical protein MHPSP_004015, partial [Paramarteilia canceri]